MLAGLNTLLGKLNGQVGSPVVQSLLVQVGQGPLIAGVRLAKYYGKGLFLDHFYPSALVQSEATVKDRSSKL